MWSGEKLTYHKSVLWSSAYAKKIIADKSNLITLSRYLLFFGSQGAEKVKSQKRFELKKNSSLQLIEDKTIQISDELEKKPWVILSDRSCRITKNSRCSNKSLVFCRSDLSSEISSSCSKIFSRASYSSFVTPWRLEGTFSRCTFRTCSTLISKRRASSRHSAVSARLK